MKKLIIIAIIFILGGLASYLVFNSLNSGQEEFEKLSEEEMHERIIQERDYAIGQAVMAGDYKCCISPPCTMCYMEANEYNNHKAGTCACDELIAQGKEPCPQCKGGLMKDTGSSCEVSAAACEASKDLNNN